MRRPRIVGTLQPVFKPVEIDYDANRGLIVTEGWRSAGDNLSGKFWGYVKKRISAKWTRGQSHSEVTATISGGQGGVADFPQPNWQLLCNEIQKDIFESPYALEGTDLFPFLPSHVRGTMEDLAKGDEDTTRDLLPEDELPYYDYLLGKLMRGQTAFARGQYALKRTISISNFYNGNIAGEEDAERNLSTGIVLSEFDIPPVMSQKISGIPIPAAHAGYAWGWRQLPSQMVSSAQNRVEVSTEWWFDEWDTTLYPPA